MAAGASAGGAGASAGAGAAGAASAGAALGATTGTSDSGAGVLAGRAGGLDKSTSGRPQARAASRAAPWATTPMGCRRCSRSACNSAGQSMDDSIFEASMTTGSFSKNEPASFMRWSSAAWSCAVSPLCSTTRTAYSAALLKSSAAAPLCLVVDLLTALAYPKKPCPTKYQKSGLKPSVFVNGGRLRVPAAIVLAPSYPRVPQRGAAVEHRPLGRGIETVGHELAQPFELPEVFGVRLGAGLEPGLDGLERVGVEGIEVVLVAAVGVRVGEQAVVQPDLGGDGVCRADPGDVALDLDRVGARRAAFG